MADFLDTLERIANGASVMDSALVAELVSARRRNDPLAALSTREQAVLTLMAEGRSNAGIAHRLWVTEGTVEKHVHSILTKLNLPESDDDHRRVLALITFLEAPDVGGSICVPQPNLSGHDVGSESGELADACPAEALVTRTLRAARCTPRRRTGQSLATMPNYVEPDAVSPGAPNTRQFRAFRPAR